MLRILILLIVAAAYLPALGHGDVHQRIDIVTEEIALDSMNGHLFVKRASLYLEDGDFMNTVLDLETAVSLTSEDFPPYLMASANMYHKLGAYDAALKYIDRFLEMKNIHVLGFRTKANILQSKGDIDAAIKYETQL